MKSGLEGRNNSGGRGGGQAGAYCLNEVRPRRPEQWASVTLLSITT